MEALNGYTGIILLAGFILLSALAAIMIAGQFRLLKKIASNRFSFLAYEEVNEESGERGYAVVVSNRSLNDVCVNTFGIRCGIKYFDLTEKFKRAFECGEGNAMQSRVTVKFNLQSKELQRLIFSQLHGTSVKSVKIYLIDHAGNCFEQRVPRLEMALKTEYRKYIGRVKAAKCAKKRFDGMKEKFIFCQRISAKKENGEKISLNDRIRNAYFGRIITKEKINEAQLKWKRAEFFAALFTEEEFLRAEGNAIEQEQGKTVAGAEKLTDCGADTKIGAFEEFAAAAEPSEEDAEERIETEASGTEPVEEGAEERIETEAPKTEPVEEGAEERIETEAPGTEPVEEGAEERIETEAPKTEPVEEGAEEHVETEAPKTEPVEEDAEEHVETEVAVKY